MATATTQDKRISAKVETEAKSSGVLVDAPSRREFLYYIWGASIALLLGEVTAGLLWFAFPRFKEGEFGGVFNVDPTTLPAISSRPETNSAGRFHMSYTEEGIKALYGVCTHLGCLPKWTPSNFRFECPCHGSKFELAGTYIEGPAPRSLDQFPVTVTFADGSTATTPADGSAVPVGEVSEIVKIEVDTGKRITGSGI